LSNDLRLDFLDFRNSESRLAVAVCVQCEPEKEVLIWKIWKLGQEVLDRNEYCVRLFGLLFLEWVSANGRGWEWSSSFGSRGRRGLGRDWKLYWRFVDSLPTAHSQGPCMAMPKLKLNTKMAYSSAGDIS
jgi:hypothetical protein